MTITLMDPGNSIPVKWGNLPKHPDHNSVLWLEHAMCAAEAQGMAMCAAEAEKHCRSALCLYEPHVSDVSHIIT